MIQPASRMIEVNAISMRVRGVTLLNNISFALNGGETVAIVGPNGAGKSTLLRLLSGDHRYSSGAIRLKGRELTTFASRDLASHRAMLSQHVSVGFPFTVEEIVAMGVGDRSRSIAQPLIDGAIAELDLEPFRHREMPTLSGGEQQRAHFARVLVQLSCGETEHGPGLLLLDEPTSSLDLRHQIGLIEIARHRARNGTAVLAVLHDLNLATRFADRIIVLHRGAIVIDGSPVQTITGEMLQQVFDIDTAVGFENGQPYVLAQRMHQKRGT